jgi:hypothetical protein
MKVLLHVNPEPVAAVINGRLHTLEPGIPYRLDEHLPADEGTGLGSPKNPQSTPVNVNFIAEKLIEHLWWAGVVEVPVERSNYGDNLLVEEAIAKATQELIRSDSKTVDEYIEVQQNRALEGKPALVPSGRYLIAIQRRGVKLSDYGINPVGAGPVIAEQAAQGMEVAKLRKELEEQKLETTRVLEMAQQLMERLSQSEPQKKAEKVKV